MAPRSQKHYSPYGIVCTRSLVSSFNFSGNGNPPTFIVTLRVPSHGYNSVLTYFPQLFSETTFRLVEKRIVCREVLRLHPQNSSMEMEVEVLKSKNKNSSNEYPKSYR
ncbi:Uncharacterized protein Fot_16699 [Forsythia ovata]|uniref:Uncharacterized protein n=1 Tax=Forsythia ovata TaxID=205694 RepID=A0ABD1VFD9_9LAMI